MLCPGKEGTARRLPLRKEDPGITTEDVFQRRASTPPRPQTPRKHKCVIPSKRSLLPWFRCLESCITAAAPESPFQSQKTAAGVGPVEDAGNHFYSSIVLCACRFGAECGLSSGLGRLHSHFWGGRMRSWVSSSLFLVVTSLGSLVEKVAHHVRGRRGRCFFRR